MGRPTLKQITVLPKRNFNYDIDILSYYDRAAISLPHVFDRDNDVFYEINGKYQGTNNFRFLGQMVERGLGSFDIWIHMDSDS